MTKLNKARQIINETDSEMARLFEKRMDAVRTVAEYKKENGLPVDDLSREDEMIKRNSMLVENEELRSYYVNFLKSNIEISKKYQHKLLDGMRVAYSGVAGAFANIVSKKAFPDALCVPYPDFKSAYNAVVSGDCDCAVLPVENSYNGDVGNVLDLAFFGSLYINGIYEIDIIQNLLAKKDAHIENIKTVASHPQALGQASSYIESHGFKRIETVNTAVAAKQVADGDDLTIAAIGSVEAAKEFGLKVLEKHINESNVNTTRFAVFTRTQSRSSETDDRFIMLFTVKNMAGSLGNVISVIGKYGFNLRALKSRPTKELIWDYYFYAEGEGNINSEQGKKMVEKLQKCCCNLKIIASFEREIKI